MKGLIAKRVGVTADKVKNAIIWGNHSSTQFPDLKNATIDLPQGTVSAYDAVKDEEWIQGEFIKVKFVDIICMLTSHITHWWC